MIGMSLKIIKYDHLNPIVMHNVVEAKWFDKKLKILMTFM